MVSSQKFSILLVLLLLVGCSGKSRIEGTYQYFERIEDGIWHANDELFFSSSELKPQTRYNVLLVLRLDRAIPYQSIPIGITYETPTRHIETEEVVVPIQRRVHGKGGYNIIEQTTVIEQGAEFPNEGVYTYSLRHLSTDSILTGIVEVGLLIEPSK